MEEITRDNPLLREILADQAKQLDAWSVAKPEYTLGRVIDFDPASGTITTPDIEPTLIRRQCRPEFKIPEFG